LSYKLTFFIRSFYSAIYVPKIASLYLTALLSAAPVAAATNNGVSSL